MVTVSDAGLDVGSEGPMWDTPRKRALFGPEGQNSVMEARSGWPPDVEYPEAAQSGWPPDDDYLQGARPPVVDLAWQHSYRKKWRSSG